METTKYKTHALQSQSCETSLPTCTSPRPTQPIEEPDWAKLVPGILNARENLNSYEVMHKLQCAVKAVQTAMQNDYWFTGKGQENLRKKTKERSTPGLDIFDDAPATKAGLCPNDRPGR